MPVGEWQDPIEYPSQPASTSTAWFGVKHAYEFIDPASYDNAAAEWTAVAGAALGADELVNEAIPTIDFFGNLLWRFYYPFDSNPVHLAAFISHMGGFTEAGIYRTLWGYGPSLSRVPYHEPDVFPPIPPDAVDIEFEDDFSTLVSCQTHFFLAGEFWHDPTIITTKPTGWTVNFLTQSGATWSSGDAPTITPDWGGSDTIWAAEAEALAAADPAFEDEFFDGHLIESPVDLTALVDSEGRVNYGIEADLGTLFDLPPDPISTATRYETGKATINGPDYVYLSPRWRWVYAGSAPPCRIFPRSDNLGVGSGRIYPPPVSQQASSRRAGTYY